MNISDISLDIRQLTEATSSKIGQDYFDSLLEYLSHALKVNTVFIGELVDDNSAVQTKSVFSNGRRSDNFTYELSGTPCAEVAEASACVFNQGIQQQFPNDILLKELGVEGYIGIPLNSLSGIPFGLIVALHTKPILNEDVIRTYFDLVVERIAAEYERLKVMEQLSNQETKFRDLVHCSADFIWEVNENAEYTASTCSPTALLGYTTEELVAKSIFDSIPKQERARIRRKFHAIWKKRQTFSGLEHIKIHKNGELVYVESSGVPIIDSNGLFKGYRGLDRNITERKKKIIELQLAATIFETATEAMMVTDLNDCIIKVNKAFSTITGYLPDEILGKTPSVLKSGYQDAHFYIEMFNTLQATGKWEGEIWNKRKNGEIFPEWLIISELRDEQDGKSGYVSFYQDITKRKEYEDKIEYQANYDVLTGLANWHLLADRLSQGIDRAARNKNRVALLFVGLHRFKRVNESLGHAFGDKVLQEVASRLNQSVRKSDTTARLGGIEFAAIFPDLADLQHAEDSISRILGSLSQPYLIDGNEVFLSASIGMTVYPDHGNTVENLLRNADNALHKAKTNGCNTFQYYSSEMHEEAQKKLLLEVALRRAVNQNEFVLHYQPIVDSLTRKVVGCEALIRWIDPELGIVSPLEFIPLAEDTGLIIEIGEWVLNEACRQISSILPNCAGDCYVAINVSSFQFQKNYIPLLVQRTLEKYKLSSNNLVIEITESLMLNEDVMVLSQLEALRNMGVAISIDDFGTGYSSLSYLQKYPISTLKIDKAFVNEITVNKQSRSLIVAMISMSKGLGLKTVGEGIEEEAQAVILAEEGCQFFQGYLFSKPLPFEQFKHFMHTADQSIEKH